MAILKIARMGHPLLRRAAEVVDDLMAPSIHRLIQDMIDTLADTGGVGLAAPQVHVSKRIVIFHVPEGRALSPEEEVEAMERGDGINLKDVSRSVSEAVPMTVLINPTIEALDDEIVSGVEGCLSLPGMLGVVPRYKRIRYKAVMPDGSEIKREASGFHARVVQHECDHLDGILYPTRMADLSTFGYSEEMDSSGLLLSEEIEVDEND